MTRQKNELPFEEVVARGCWLNVHKFERMKKIYLFVLLTLLFQISKGQNSISPDMFETTDGIEMSYTAPDFGYNLPVRYYYTLANKASKCRKTYQQGIGWDANLLGALPNGSKEKLEKAVATVRKSMEKQGLNGHIPYTIIITYDHDGKMIALQISTEKKILLKNKSNCGKIKRVLHSLDSFRFPSLANEYYKRLASSHNTTKVKTNASKLFCRWNFIVRK